MNISFVICINNQDYEVSLERWKVYKALDDKIAHDHNQIRVIDESGEDYLYPDVFFKKIRLPKSVQEDFIKADVC